jgi:hypothetical protein
MGWQRSRSTKEPVWDERCGACTSGAADACRDNEWVDVQDQLARDSHVDDCDRRWKRRKVDEMGWMPVASPLVPVGYAAPV